MSNIKNIVDSLMGLTVKELIEVETILKEEHGISLVAPQAALEQSSSGSSASEKTSFDVVLVSFGQQKLNVVKVAKGELGLSLKEAKDLVESAPKTLKSDVSKADAEALKAKFEEVGASIELK